MATGWAIKDRYYAKTWIAWAVFWVFLMLSVVPLTMGPLFMTGTMRTANGRKDPQAGLAMTVTGACLLPVPALAGFQILARRKPVLRLYREGLELRTGATPLLPAIPGFSRSIALLNIVWAVVSGGGFRTVRLRVEWTDLRGAEIVEMPLERGLLLLGTVVRAGAPGELLEVVDEGVVLDETTLADPIEHLAQTLRIAAGNPHVRHALPSWHESE